MSSTVHQISLAQAIAMTTLYRQQKEGLLKDAYAGKNLLPLCESFERAAFEQLLSQPGCVGIRHYYSMTPDLQVHGIFVAFNEKDEDLLPTGTNATGEPTGIVEEGRICPPNCPAPSPLAP